MWQIALWGESRPFWHSKREVIKRIKEEWGEDPSIKAVDDFKVMITDSYETTEYEI